MKNFVAGAGGMAHNQGSASLGADRFGILSIRGARPQAIWGFFFAQHCLLSTGDRAGESKDSLVTLSQHSNPVRSPTPIGIGMVDFQSTKRITQMNPILQRAAALAAAFPIRFIQFIRSCIRLRSVSAAIWLDSYDRASRKSK